MSLDDPRALAAAAADASRLSGQRVHFDRARRFNAAVGAARFVLDNGLTILFGPDERAPVFAYQTWFKVGSRHEHPERTGLAHLFEHLMFKGTRRHAAGELDREMERRGSQTNAATWVDWTYYHEALAARGDNLETVVDFEVDRMTNLVLDAETFASELEVVKNERRMTVDDSVGGILSEELYALAYTTHPYRWQTIGSMAHVSAATLSELERFYRAYYAPNNAIVVVTGALELVPTLSLLARSYGSVAPQPVPPAPALAEPRQTAPRERTLTKPVLAPQLVLGWHTPAGGHLDFTAAQLLGEILVEGDNARLYRRLVTDDKLASTVEGALMPFAEPGLYEVFLAARQGVAPAELVAATQAELDRLAAAGPAADEEDKARSSLELAFFDGFRGAIGLAESLGHHEASFGDFAEAFKGHERIGAVSRDDLVRVTREVFRVDNRSTVVAIPSGEEGEDA